MAEAAYTRRSRQAIYNEHQRGESIGALGVRLGRQLVWRQSDVDNYIAQLVADQREGGGPMTSDPTADNRLSAIPAGVSSPLGQLVDLLPEALLDAVAKAVGGGFDPATAIDEVGRLVAARTSEVAGRLAKLMEVET